MNCLTTKVSSYITAAIFRTTRRSFSSSSRLDCAGVKLINFESAVSRFRTRLYSSSSKTKTKTTSSSRSPRKKKSMEKEPYYVVRKGNVVGVYKSLAECQAQQGPSICDEPVSVYKGYSMLKKDEEFLASVGLRNALYTISAADMRDNLLGELVECSLQECETSSVKAAVKKRSHQELESENVEVKDSPSVSAAPSKKQAKTKVEVEVPSSSRGCTLHFDGASKGNPGAAGAGAVLRADDGSLICKLREGLGVATNNAAEYRAVILGLKYALEKGFSRIFVQGDSKLVCMQVQGQWQVKHPNIATLYEEVKKLKDKFVFFKISHVLRDLNSEADAQANLAITLPDGQVQEEPGEE